MVVTMRKSRVAQWSRFTETWLVQTPQGNLIVSGWDEALFLAQLLADPHEYIRAAQERAWHGGKSVGRIQEYFKIPGPISPYREETQS